MFWTSTLLLRRPKPSRLFDCWPYINHTMVETLVRLQGRLEIFMSKVPRIGPRSIPQTIERIKRRRLVADEGSRDGAALEIVQRMKLVA